MREKDRQGYRMVTADQTMSEAQSKLLRIIRHMVEGGTPTMEAYRLLGGKIGHNPSWIQRVISRRDQVVVQAHDWLNILALCDRLDAASARNEASAAKIRGEINAAREARSIALAMDEVGGVAGVGEGHPLVDEDRQ